MMHLIKVDMQSDTVKLANFGKGGGNAAPLGARINIAIDSNEDDATVNELAARVLPIDKWFLALRVALSVNVDWKRMKSVAA